MQQTPKTSWNAEPLWCPARKERPLEDRAARAAVQ